MLQSDSNSRFNNSLPPIFKMFIEVYYVKSVFHSNILNSLACNSGCQIQQESFPIENVEVNKCYEIAVLKVSYQPCCYKHVISE